MDPAHDAANDAEITLSALVRSAGPAAVLALVAGVVVLVLALRLASRRGPRRYAYALFAAAWLTFLPVIPAGSLSEFPILLRGTSFGSVIGHTEIARLLAGPGQEPATVQFCALGLLLGLVGAVAAFACSREDARAAESDAARTDGPTPGSRCGV